MQTVDLRDIDDVVTRLDEIIDQALASGDRMGWFAAMYRRVTIAVRQGIVDDRFRDGAGMARFDKVFADRFIAAWDDVQAGRRPSRAWQVAFDNADKRRLIIVQQLLLGMNAHINLDLGIAAATVAPGSTLGNAQRDVFWGEGDLTDRRQEFKADFNEINTLLNELTKSFVNQVADLSPWIGLLDRFGGTSDDTIIRFTIDGARFGAWGLTNALSSADADAPDQVKLIDEADLATQAIGEEIARPLLLLPVLAVIRAREPNDVNTVTRFLRESP